MRKKPHLIISNIGISDMFLSCPELHFSCNCYHSNENRGAYKHFLNLLNRVRILFHDYNVLLGYVDWILIMCPVARR